MAFKEGTEVEHVHAFRALINLGRDLDNKIDGELITPHEALAEMQKAISGFPEAPKARKKVAA